MLVPFKLFKRVPFDLGAKVQINGQIGHVSRTGRCIPGDSRAGNHLEGSRKPTRASRSSWSEDMDCFFVSVASRDAAGSSAKAVILPSDAKLHGANARIFGSASVIQAAIHSGKSSYAVGRETVPPEILEYIGNRTSWALLGAKSCAGCGFQSNNFNQSTGRKQTTVLASFHFQCPREPVRMSGAQSLRKSFACESGHCSLLWQSATATEISYIQVNIYIAKHS